VSLFEEDDEEETDSVTKLRYAEFSDEPPPEEDDRARRLPALIET
jgi:hypothetical protein